MIRLIAVAVAAFFLGSISTRLFYTKQIHRLKVARSMAFKNGWGCGIKEGKRKERREDIMITFPN